MDIFVMGGEKSGHLSVFYTKSIFVPVSISISANRIQIPTTQDTKKTRNPGNEIGNIYLGVEDLFEVKYGILTLPRG